MNIDRIEKLGQFLVWVRLKYMLPQWLCGNIYITPLWQHMYLASVRFEHSVCRGSLMTTFALPVITKWLCGNSCTWAHDVRGSLMMTYIYIRGKGKRNQPTSNTIIYI